MKKEAKTKKVAVVKEQQISTPDEMIRMGITNGSDLDKLEKLLILKRQFDADEARKVYCVNMVLVQKDIPTVAKSLKNAQTHSSYAALDDIIRKTKAVYTGYGFSISFYEGKAENPEDVRIYADVIQSLGHKETYHYDVPMDGKGIQGKVNMTPIHAKASSATYGQRKLMCMIWNIPTGDDNDGNTQSLELITEEQLHTIRDMLISLGIEKKEGKLVELLKIDKLENLPKNKYQQAVSILETKRAKKGKEKKENEDN